MLTAICPKLPMRNKAKTIDYYVNGLNFTSIGVYDGYLLLAKDAIELHFFQHNTLDPLENYGQVYIRTNAIDALYELVQKNGVAIHPNGPLHTKPWGQREFALLDPDNNLLTFGEAI